MDERWIRGGGEVDSSIRNFQIGGRERAISKTNAQRAAHDRGVEATGLDERGGEEISRGARINKKPGWKTIDVDSHNQ